MARLTGSLDDVRATADASYPDEYLDGCGDALVLFAAAFLGRQDGIWILDRGMTAVCVDVRSASIRQMAGIYPSDWEFVQADVYELVDRHELPEADLVSVDCPSGQFGRCADLVDRFCALARRVVILGCGETTEIFAPSGWKIAERRLRSRFAGGTCWAVLVREIP